jgi:putative endonuclease
MYYVYLLRSKAKAKVYIGFTNDLKRRLGEHNSRLVKSTKIDAPWEILYYEAFKDQELAKSREYNLKYFGKAYGQLKRRIGL